MVQRITTVQRGLLMTVLPVAALLVLPGSGIPANLAKLGVLVWIAAAVVAVDAARLWNSGRVLAPWGLGAVAVAAFLVVAFVVTARAPVSRIAWMGQDGRFSGLVLYAACAVVLVSVARLFDPPSVATMARWGVATLGLTSLYGLLQWWGVDPIDWDDVYSPIKGTVGNPNFASALLGILVPVGAWAAINQGHRAPWRVLGGASATLGFVIAVASRSVQGPVAALSGLTIVLLAWLLNRYAGARRRLAVTAWVGALVIGAVLAVTGFAGQGPLSRLDAAGSLEVRGWYWEAAVDMWRDRPIAGVGMAHYGGYYRQYRPDAATVELGVRNTNDAPHSVPLAMLAEGGLLLAFAYLAVVTVSGWALVRGLWIRQGADRLLVGGMGGAWAAYQVQSLVSIDVPALAMLHWLLAGGVIALGLAPASRAWSPAVAAGGKRRSGGRLAAWRRPVAGVVILGMLAVVVLSTRPLRAEQALAEARGFASMDEGALALEAHERAIAQAPQAAQYWADRGRLFVQAGMLDRAYESYREAFERDPLGFEYAITAGRLAVSTERIDEAAELFERAERLDPSGIALLDEVVEFWIDHGDAARAVRLAQEALRLYPADEAHLLLAARAHAAAGQRDKAVEILEALLTTQPDHEEAGELLTQLRSTQ